MKLSLWTQFSSNHSGSYVIVGQFPTKAMAQQAKSNLLAMLYEVVGWWEHVDIDKVNRQWKYDADEKNKLTPPEAKIRDTYQLTSYTSALDWSYGIIDVEAAVQGTKNIVIVDPPTQTWNTPYPLVELLEKRGAEVHFAWHSEYLPQSINLYFTMACEFNDTTALEIAWLQIRQFTDEDGTAVFEVPGLRATRGTIERDALQLRFIDVGVYAYFYEEDLPPITYEQQLQAIFDFVEQYPCTIHYRFFDEGRV